MMWVWVCRHVCMWLCVFYNGAPGLGPGLLLRHTRLPHTHIHKQTQTDTQTHRHKQTHTRTHQGPHLWICYTGRVIFADDLKTEIVDKHASSELFCFLHITENVETTAWIWWYAHGLCTEKNLEWSPAAGFFVFFNHKWPVRPSCRASPSLPSESQRCLCWWEPSTVKTGFCLSRVPSNQICEVKKQGYFIL